jgi:hypothetical protein
VTARASWAEAKLELAAHGIEPSGTAGRVSWNLDARRVNTGSVVLTALPPRMVTLLVRLAHGSTESDPDRASRLRRALEQWGSPAIVVQLDKAHYALAWGDRGWVRLSAEVLFNESAHAVVIGGVARLAASAQMKLLNVIVAAAGEFVHDSELAAGAGATAHSIGPRVAYLRRLFGGDGGPLHRERIGREWATRLRYGVEPVDYDWRPEPGSVVWNGLNAQPRDSLGLAPAFVKALLKADRTDARVTYDPLEAELSIDGRPFPLEPVALLLLALLATNVKLSVTDERLASFVGVQRVRMEFRNLQCVLAAEQLPALVVRPRRGHRALAWIDRGWLGAGDDRLHPDAGWLVRAGSLVCLRPGVLRVFKHLLVAGRSEPIASIARGSGYSAEDARKALDALIALGLVKGEPVPGTSSSRYTVAVDLQPADDVDWCAVRRLLAGGDA